MTRTQVTPPEVEMLMAMDDAFVSQLAIEKQGMREQQQANKAKKA